LEKRKTGRKKGRRDLRNKRRYQAGRGNKSEKNWKERRLTHFIA
jgi:hypothetical protein